MLQQALESEPNAPDLLNNLAVAYELQGRRAAYEALLRRLHERFPDYLFARTGLAQLLLERGETEPAAALIEPLLARRRFHFSEFAAFCHAQAALLAAQGKREAAGSWLQMWADTSPDDPRVPQVRQQLGLANHRPRPGKAGERSKTR